MVFNTYEELRAEMVSRLDGREPFLETAVRIPDFIDSVTLHYGTPEKIEVVHVTYKDLRDPANTWWHSNSDFILFNNLKAP